MSRCDSLNCPFHDIFCKIWSWMWMACVCVSNVKWQQVERGRRVDISTHDFSPFSLPNETFYDPKQKFLCHRMPENHVDIERQWTRYVIGSEIIEWKLSPSNPQANIIAIKWEKVLKIFIWADTWHFHTESIAIQKHRSVKRVYNCEWMDYEGLLLLVWIIKEKWKLESLEITSHNRILEGFDLKSYKECRGFQRVIKCLIYHKVLTFCHGNVIKLRKWSWLGKFQGRFLWGFSNDFIFAITSIDFYFKDDIRLFGEFLLKL